MQRIGDVTANSGVAENRMSPSAKWKLLLSSFINIPSEQLELSVQVNNDSLLVSTSQRDIAEKIIAILNSPEKLRASLNYTLVEVNHSPQSAPAVMMTYPPIVKLQHGTGEKTYERLFGKDTLRHHGYINWNGEVPRADCFVLQGSCDTQDSKFDDTQINTYKELLSSATFEELRAALTSDALQYRPLPNRRTLNGVLAKHIDKIIYRSNDNTSVFLDYGLLINCIHAPEMEILNIALQSGHEERFEIEIDKTHLINYFSTIFKEGFVLNVHGDEDAKTQQATPILFSIKRAMHLKNVVSLVLDCSGSMHEHRDAYIAHVKAFISRLAKEPDYQDAEIKLVRFSDDSFTYDFKLSDLPNILKFLDGLTMDGKTNLNATMKKVLAKHLINSQSNENVTVVVFTDGQDTGTADHKTELEQTSNELSKKQGMRPRIFALGLGSEYDEAKLIELANLTGGAFIKLMTIDDFKMILSHLEEMGHIKEFMTFIQDEITTFVTPTYVNDLSVASQSLTIPGTFSVAGKTYQADRGHPELLDQVLIEKESQSAPASTTVNLEALLANLDAATREAVLKQLAAAKVPATVTPTSPERDRLFSHQPANKSAAMSTPVTASTPTTLVKL